MVVSASALVSKEKKKTVCPCGDKLAPTVTVCVEKCKEGDLGGRKD
jgi:hypothetical protein